MALKQRGFAAVFKRTYHMIIGLVVLVGMLFSFVWLAAGAKRGAEDSRRFESNLDLLKPAHPDVPRVDPRPFELAKSQLRSPFALSSCSNVAFAVAPELVWCVNCRQPIPYDADVCPKCGKDQPGSVLPEDWDSDGDGIPDVIEKMLGLNPFDPSDALLDSDGDGFTNLEEYLAGTDMFDPKSHPERIAFLKVNEIDEVPFPLMLRSSMKWSTGMRYQINDAVSGQTFNVTNGQEIGKTKFKITKEESKKVTRVNPTTNTKREVDVWVITVTRGNQSVVLEEGAARASSDYIVKFICEKDKDDVQYSASRGEKLSFDGDTYDVLSIDRSHRTVQIKRDKDGKEFTVQPR